MTTALATANQTQIAARDYSRDEVDTIRATVARGASDAQLALFLNVCRSRGLDPFSKQVHWTDRGIIVGIDGFRAIADRTGCYVPGPIEYDHDPAGKLLAARATVRKLVAGAWHDVVESAWLEEYAGGSPIWRKMPRVMLGKCAEARALRRAFPADLSGLYSPEEMEQAATDPRSSVAAPVPVAVPVAPVAAPVVQPAAPAAPRAGAQHASATPAPAAPAARPPVVATEYIDIEAEPVPAARAEAAAPSAVDRVVAAIQSAATLPAALQALKSGRQDARLSDEDTRLAFGVVLARCSTPAECNDAAVLVVEWKKLNIASEPLVMNLRADYLARKANINQKVA